MIHIPEIVKDTAEYNGFNSISFAGTIDGCQVFSVGVKDENGTPIPLGMPTFIILKDNTTSVIGGPKGLELLFRL